MALTRAQIRQQHPNWDANRIERELQASRTAAGGGGVTPTPPQLAPVGAPAPAPAPNPYAPTATRSDIRSDHPNWSPNRIATALGQANMTPPPPGGPPTTGGGVTGPGTTNPFAVPDAQGRDVTRRQIRRQNEGWSADRIRRELEQARAGTTGGGTGDPGVTGGGTTTVTGGGTGIYEGPEGIGAANRNPEQYITDLLQQGGIFTDTGTPSDIFAQQSAVNRLMREFNAALALNQNLTIVDFMNQRYGAGFSGGAVNLGSINPAMFAAEAAAAQANANPEGAILAAMRQAGMITGSGSPQDIYMQQQGLDLIMAEFFAAQQANPSLTITDFIAQNAHRLGEVTAQARNYFLNQNPEVAINAAVDESGILGANESAQYQDFFTSNGLDVIRARLDAARAGDPNFNVGDFFGGGGISGDLMRQIRRAYQMRPDYRRLPGAAPVGGRWSWWA